jgi:ABC-type glycerol-3-phosphate transport system permease component
MLSTNKFDLFDHVKLNNNNDSSSFIKNFEKVDALFSISGVTYTITPLKDGSHINKAETPMRWEEIALKAAIWALSVITILPIIAILITKGLYQREIDQTTPAPLPNNYFLFKRTPWVGHVRNQYQNGQNEDKRTPPSTATACSFIAAKTVHQLLTNPNAFLNEGNTFEQLLNEAGGEYEEALNNLNRNTEILLPMIYENLHNAFIDEGLGGVFRVSNEYRATYNRGAIHFYYHSLLLPYAKEQQWSREDTAHYLLNDLKRYIKFIRPKASLLNVDEGAGDVANKVMTRLSSGPINNYRELFKTLQNQAKERNASVGAIVHIGTFIFAVCIQVDGKILIADSHGFSFIKATSGQSPFALLVANNIDDAVSLMEMHKPSFRQNPDQTVYYSYALKEGAETTLLDSNLFEEGDEAVHKIFINQELIN